MPTLQKLQPKKLIHRTKQALTKKGLVVRDGSDADRAIATSAEIVSSVANAGIDLARDVVAAGDDLRQAVHEATAPKAAPKTSARQATKAAAKSRRKR